MTECPTVEQIEMLASGALEREAAAAVWSHVGSCPTCRERLGKARKEEVFADEPPSHTPSSDGGSAPQQSARTSTIRVAIFGYEMVRALSHGGQGVVYEAMQISTKRKVAIKLLLEGDGSEPARRRFEREVELAAGLRHANIVPILESGVAADGRRYYAMDLVEGRPLNKHVESERMAMKDVLTLFVKVCRAIEYAHQRGVIHRDLKPGNILVDAEGEPRILDFGLAKQLGAVDQSRLSLTGEIIGTPAYMSPEQARGRLEEVDTRADLYALGMILYELLTGGFPYPITRDIVALVRHIIETEPYPARKQWDRSSGIAALGGARADDCPIDDEVETIVMKLLSKERERRYQSAGEVAADIERYLAGEPIDAKRDSAMYVLRKTLHRYRVPAALGAAFLVLIASASLALSVMYGKAEERAARTRADREKEVADAVNDFLTKDLLAAVAPSTKSGRGKGVLMRDVLDEAAKRIEKASGVGGRFEKMPLVDASIRATLGRTYLRLGEYAAAEVHLERARALTHRELGEEDPSTLDALNGLALLYKNQGRYVEAERLHVQTLEIQKRVLGEEHPDTVDSINNLANVIRKQGRYDDAEPLYVDTLEIRKRILGEEHPDTLGAMLNLATLHWRQGRYP